MKRALLILPLLTLSPLAVLARGGGQGFGLGLAIGEPTGINGKKTLGASTALDSTLGLNFLNGNGFSLHLCFLWEAVLGRAASGNFDGYLGLGGKLGVYDHNDDRHRSDSRSDNGLWLGGRAPAGVAFVFNGAPVDIWLEIAAVLWAVENPGIDIDGTLGVRYWF